MTTYEPEFVEVCMNFRAPAFRTTNEGCPAPPTNLVLRFLDSHLDDRLILKHVVRVPDLASKLSVVADENVAKLDLRGIDKAIVGLGYSTYRDTTSIVKASAVAYTQTEGISSPCLQLGSSLFMHPRNPLHPSIFDWIPLPALKPDWDEKEPHEFVVQDYALGISANIPDYPRALPAEVLQELESMRRCYPFFSLGMFFSPAAHDVLQDMGSLGDAESFPWQMTSRCSGKAPTAAAKPTHDARDSLWELPLGARPRRVIDPKLGTASDSPVYSKAGTISSVPRISAGHNVAHYFQRAWVNAVMIDATTIIFDCGRSLRIGIRSRRYQTLYISDLIESSALEGPPYGKIMAGLYLGSVYDLVKRCEYRQRHAALKASLKRPLGATDSAQSKRRRLSPSNQPPTFSRHEMTEKEEEKRRAQTQKQSVQKEKNTRKCFSRPVLALHFAFGIYNSPTPLILLSPETSKSDAYVQKEYLSVILDVRIAKGATGTVFGGRLGPNACLPRGRTDFSFVVKVATTSAKLFRLRREYGIYTHLHSAKVKGIPPVFGYFEDVDQEAGALVLANVGLPLRTHKIELPSDKSDQLREVVDGIHDAGVLHGDIRSWNMLLDSDERVWIIDFDHASLEGSERDYVAESERLERFIKGKYIDRDPVLVPHRPGLQSESSEDCSDSQSGDESYL
ncbi:hypothetical protein BDZ89DRAFT_1056311 [Hymenopellis radicata]|nr:hypothetical protein BDZ89DRAFT_1056311 [Hymenopellis radicata]